MRSGGVLPLGTSRFLTSTARSSCWRPSAATRIELVLSSTSITGSRAKPALWPSLPAARPSRYALASAAFACASGITRTSALGEIAVTSWRQASLKRASGSSSPLATMVPLGASISVSITHFSPSRGSSEASLSAFATTCAGSPAPTSITRTPRLTGTTCSCLRSCSVLSNVMSSPATMSVRLIASVCTITSTGFAPSWPGLASMPRAARSRRLDAMRSMSPFSTW